MGGHDTSRSRLGLFYWWHHTNKHNSAFSVPIQKTVWFPMNKHIDEVEKLGPGAYQRKNTINSLPSLLPQPMRCEVSRPPRRCGHSRRRQTPPRARQPISGRERGNALEAPDAPLSHPNTRRHLVSLCPGRARRVAPRRVPAAARCAPPSDPPVPAPPPPPPTRECNGHAHARHRRCTGARSRAPMHERVQRCSFLAHAHCCCSSCSRRRRRRAEQRARPPLCPARPAPALRARPAVPAPSRPAAAPARAAAAAAAAAVDSNSQRAPDANTASPRHTRLPLCKLTPCLLPSLVWPRLLRGHRGRQWGAAPEPANRRAGHLGGMQISLRDI